MLQLEKTLEGLEVQHYKLHKSYRSTREIMEYANQFLKEEKV
jgi:DNA helicase-2/ATP-dependent DNA helicase PcrA